MNAKRVEPSKTVYKEICGGIKQHYETMRRAHLRGKITDGRFREIHEKFSQWHNQTIPFYNSELKQKG